MLFMDHLVLVPGEETESFHVACSDAWATNVSWFLVKTALCFGRQLKLVVPSC
jgi:hypothetical protein